MLRNDKDLSETDIRHPESCMLTVRADDAGDGRPWHDAGARCRLLDGYHIEHAGVGRMPAPFEIVRTALGGSYFLSCFGGSGEVLVNGRWETCGVGEAFLLAPGTLHAFRATTGGRWDFSWVRYREVAGQKPVARASSPVMARFPAQPFLHAVSGLYHASAAPEARPAAVAQWVDLVHNYVLEYAQPAGGDARLDRVWEAVGRDLAADWSTASMAEIAHVSEKQLERLCKRDLGRTPRQHLIALRMHRAAELLTSTDATVESIAAAVGYQNPFTFSTRFRRFSGWPPSRYPARL
ncbi:MAG: AraC-like DNA-binding protein [Pseudoalteromonas tetraodonis]|jgi:AraC-like DNA-binding protein